MNYRNIIRSRDLRIKILSYLGWVPDSIMLRLQYWLQTGRTLHLNNPQRFTEKLQVYKMKYRNPEMLRCTDKYEVRSYVKEKGLGDCLIPLIGVYKKVDEIDFTTLPNQFVAKTTDGGGGNQVLICRDKRELSEAEFRNRLLGWMKMPKKKQVGREWAYENHFPRRIIIEKLIGNNTAKDLPDYKFFCFNGKPLYCQLIQGRTSDLTIDFYDMEWQRMPFTGLTAGVNCSDSIVDIPANFEEMKAIATKLSKGYPFVRVDLYNVDGATFFGELTFYPSSGYGNFTPDNWDEKLGELLSIPESSLIGGGKYIIENGIIKQISLNDDLIDYKFFCFNGRCEMLYIIADRKLGGDVSLGVFTRDFQKLNVCRSDERPMTFEIQKPVGFEKMIEYAERLAQPFPQVRVDLYNVEGKIWFGELTFYDGSGYFSFIPDSFDFELGNKFDFPK